MGAPDFPISAGMWDQKREMYARKILAEFPERALDPVIQFGDIELEYIRLYNEGLIPDKFAESNYTDVTTLGVLPATGPGSAISNTAILNQIFQVPGTYYFPVRNNKNLYMVDNTVTIGPNVNIICHPSAEFYLKSFVRNPGDPHIHMFVTDPAKANGIISWTGGTVNSNEGNQIGQGGDGVNYDVFKGIIFQNASKVTIKEMKFRNQRGSAVEYWNINHFIADDIEVQSLIPTVNGQKSGGYRRGGLTGHAKNVYINNIYGYAGDDLVCVLAGVDWGQPGKTKDHVDNAIITNIRPTEKLNELGRGTWTGVAAYAQNGYSFKNLIIDNVAGSSQGSMVRVGSYSYGSDIEGTIKNDFHNISISNISGCMKGYTLPDGLYNVGVVPSVAFISLPSLTCKTITVSNVSMQMYADEIFDNAIISAGGSAIEKMTINNVKFNSDSITVSDCPIFGQGSAGYVKEISFTDCGHSYPKAATYGTRIIYNSLSTSTVVARVSYSGCTSGAYLAGDSPLLNTSVVNGKITPLSAEIVMDFTNTSITAAALAIFHDRASGVIAYREGSWVTVVPRTFTYSTNQGKPTTGKWNAGFRVHVTGSPFKSITGYVCTDAGQFGSGNPNFSPIWSNMSADNTSLGPTASISNFVPGVMVSNSIGGSEATGWPGPNLPGQVNTFRGLSDIYSYQEYRPRQTTRLFIRFWDTATVNWSAWVEKV